MQQSNELFCCICGLLILEKERKNKEHEPPLSRGGTPDGWKWAHFICNCIKGNMTNQEFERVATQRYIKALHTWNIKQRDKQIIKRILKEKHK